MTSLEAKFYFLLPPGGDPARFSCDPGSDHAPNQLVVDRVPVTFPIPGLILNESHVSMWMNCLNNCLLKPPPFTRDCDSGNLAPDATTTVDVEDNFVSQGKEFPCEATQSADAIVRKKPKTKVSGLSRVPWFDYSRMILDVLRGGQNVKGKGKLQAKRKRGRPRKVADPNTVSSGGQ
ncbi:hypothetical protein R3P38DRAFT_2770998 [Favolaschia claudopus]|uniref:Uncharacterized protein n=1 Tax=Favolaschia claudopus TaxID=2862362 RepID=A0AAW0CED5_9AGAR